MVRFAVTLGKFEEAIAHFTEAIVNYPTFATLFAKRARWVCPIAFRAIA